VGQVVKRAEEHGLGLRDLSQSDLAAIAPRLAGAEETGDFERSVEQRALTGGTARSAVLAQIEVLRLSVTAYGESY
jgi:argininosuccinate lyase